MVKQIETEDLYTSVDVKKVREQLLKEQKGLCALTGVKFEPKDFHLDHAHDDTQYVRSALYKQSNMMLGKIENLWTRYLSYWYPYDLPTFLRQTADYLEKPQDKRWRHPGWIRKLEIKFNKLTEPKKKALLLELGLAQGSNSAERKKLFKKYILTRAMTFDKIQHMLDDI